MVGRIQYAPTTGYVRSFEIPMQFPNRIRVVLRKTTPFSSPFGAAYGAYSIRPYKRVRAALQKTVLFSSPSGPLAGRMRYAPTTGYVRFFEIPMRSSDRVRMALQKTILFSSPTGPSVGAYAIRPYDWIRAALQKTVPFSSPSGPSVGCMRYTPTTGTCGPSKNYPVFVPFGAVCGAYCIRPYNRVRAILRNTDAIPQPDTGYPMKYECASPTGDNCGLGRWGGGGYRLRGRWA